VTRALLLSLFALAGCAAPTLQQRQANWQTYRDSVRATCVVGQADPAMPDDVRDWCDSATSRCGELLQAYPEKKP
jgi:hypothetical protein